MKRNQFFVLFTMILSLLLAFQISAMADDADLPDDLKEIGEEAFYGDQSITSLTIPDGAETIGAVPSHTAGWNRSISRRL